MSATIKTRLKEEGVQFGNFYLISSITSVPNFNGTLVEIDIF